MLDEKHQSVLMDSGIAPGTAELAGWRSIDHVESNERGLGENTGILIPYFDPGSGEYNGFARLRLDHPDEQGRKYTQPQGSGNHLYFPGIMHAINPDKFSDLLRGRVGEHCNVFVVEGEKKAVSLQSRLGERGLVLGIGGCWNWTKKSADFDQETRALIDDFRHVKLRDRIVYILLDSDVSTNPNVAKAERELSYALAKAGAKKVRLISLPPSRSKPKMGVDDWLVEMGEEWEDEFRKLCRKAIPHTPGRTVIPRIFSYREMIDLEFPPTKVILGEKYFPLLNSGGLCYVHSMSGVGKTYFSMQMAHALATGSKFLGEYPTAGPQRVVFLQAELSGGWFQRRMKKLRDFFGDTDNIWVLNGQMTFGRCGQYGKFDIDLTALEQIIVSRKADVVFIDPLQGYMDLPESNTDANREFQRQLSKLRHKYECAVVVTHHDRKDNTGEGMHRMRGSSVLSDWADVVLSLEREFTVYKDDETSEKKRVATPGIVLMDFNKTRHAEGDRPNFATRLRRVDVKGHSSPWLELSPEQTA
jgi:hypothetical protein